MYLYKAPLLTAFLIKTSKWQFDTNVFAVAEKDLETGQGKTVDIMQNNSKIGVPLLVEAGVG